MNLELTLSLPCGRVVYPTKPFDLAADKAYQWTAAPDTLVRGVEPEATPVVKVSAEGMSVMAVVALLRETADQLDDHRYVELNGEVPPREQVIHDLTKTGRTHP